MAMMWLNWSVATINAMLQLLDIYRLVNSVGNRKLYLNWTKSIILFMLNLSMLKFRQFLALFKLRSSKKIETNALGEISLVIWWYFSTLWWNLTLRVKKVKLISLFSLKGERERERESEWVSFVNQIALFLFGCFDFVFYVLFSSV